MARLTDKEFIEVWNASGGSPEAVRRATGIGIRAVYTRRATLAKKGVFLKSVPSNLTGDIASRKFDWSVPSHAWERRRPLRVDKGTVIVFSDPHFYPGDQSVAYYALLELCRDLKPKAITCGGDALDGTQISRWEPTRGFHKPVPLADQLQAMVGCMNEIEKAAKGADRFWCLGNHDARLSRYLAVRAPEVENLPGTKLEDYLPRWPISWTVEVNGNTIIRHRPISGGLHSTYQSPLRAGTHFVHGHLHALNVRVVPRYGLDGTEFHYGVDAGSIADSRSDCFDYQEDSIPHVQGFAVLTFDKGRLLMPELVTVQNGTAYFRGAAIA